MVDAPLFVCGCSKLGWANVDGAAALLLLVARRVHRAVVRAVSPFACSTRGRVAELVVRLPLLAAKVVELHACGRLVGGR